MTHDCDLNRDYFNGLEKIPPEPQRTWYSCFHRASSAPRFL